MPVASVGSRSCGLQMAMACSISSPKNRTRGSASIPMPPLNPRDPFLSKLASAAAASPDPLLKPSTNTDTPPYLDLFENPKLMATPAQVERAVTYNEHRPRKPPPDLPSLLLHGRIVYIGMPLVPAVTELVIAELLYLQWMDPKQPIYLYINSTGTTRDDGETVGMESEGFAIYDAMMQLKNEAGNGAGKEKFGYEGLWPTKGRGRLKRTLMEVVKIVLKTCILSEVLAQDRSEWRNRIHVAGLNIVGSWDQAVRMMILLTNIQTVAVGAAIGQACLLLAAGKKGRRFMMPHAKAMIQQPRVPSSGLMPASDVLIRANEVIKNRDTLVKLLSRHTGNSIETVAKVMRRPFYMDSTKAQEFGVIDKILWRGQEKIMAEAASPEEWDKRAGIKVVDGM